MTSPATAEGSPEPAEGASDGCPTRKERRKALKKLKRKQIRREAAIREREAEESRSNDPEEQLRIRLREEEEAEAAERERKAFEENERLWLEAAAARKAEEEAAAVARKAEEEAQREKIQEENKSEGGDEWEYVEEGPAEIIWQGNEIIVKKKRVRVAKGNADRKPTKEDDDRPTSNPLPPQSAAFASYKNCDSAEVLEGVAKQIPNFGTEQDKAHCPFHLKTGACRFGSRCSRVHFYPDKSCTLLIKNMYNGPGLAWEQDEGLEFSCRPPVESKEIYVEEHSSGSKFWPWMRMETRVLLRSYEADAMLYAFHHKASSSSNTLKVGLRETLKCTDEEIEQCYEEFYEDVHTEFLKFGELVNFKVCKNGSYHLRGNVYVHYKSLESAILTYNAINGRFFAGKQITCEFVGITRWKVAICGEYMKSRLMTCSHGSACNFIHCFRNPGGDYEWADWDNPPPKYWIRKMYALFGPSVESPYDRQLKLEESERLRDSSRKSTPASYRRQSRKSTYDEMDMHHSGSGKEDSDGKRDQPSTRSLRRENSSKRSKRTAHTYKHEQYEENRKSDVHGHHTKYYSCGHDSGEDGSEEQDRYSHKKRQKCEEKNVSEDHERHKRKHRTEEDLSRLKTGEAFFDERGESENKYRSRYRERHGKEHGSSYRISDDTGDNGERSNNPSDEHFYDKHDSGDQEQHGERNCSDDLDRDKKSSENTAHHSKNANERRGFDRYSSRNHGDRASHDHERDGKKARSRKRESIDWRFSSDESGDGWRTADEDPVCDSRKHSSRSGRKGKQHRKEEEYNETEEQSGNQDYDYLESDRRGFNKHSRSRTPLRSSGTSLRERSHRSGQES